MIGGSPLSRVSSEAFSAFLLRTKLYWSLMILLAVGIITSPASSKGVNIFLSTGNLSDVLRQVSNNGIVAVGMSLVILTGGIDLSVGSIMALGSVLCAMLLTYDGWTSAALFSIPVFGLLLLVLVAWAVPSLAAARATDGARPPASRLVGLACGAVVAA